MAGASGARRVTPATSSPALPLFRHPAACTPSPLKCGRSAEARNQQPSSCRRRRRPLFMVAAVAAGGGGSSSGGGSDSAEAAFMAVQSCVDLFLTRKHRSDLDSIVEYLPEAVIDRLLERRASRRRDKAGEAISTQQADELGQSRSFNELLSLAQPSDLVLDAYSARGVLNAAPRSATMLSSLKLAPDRFLQRYEVVTNSGEEMVLTFDMQLEEALVPKYRGLQVVRKWFLKGITGEPACPGGIPAKPEPCWLPEAVVQAQLAALQGGDVAGVFRFASPKNKRATGPVGRFWQMLQAPQYRPLLHHMSADLLRTVQMKPDVAVVIVGVFPNIFTTEPGVTQRVLYSWTVRRQSRGWVQESAGCWMTDSVTPISQNLFML